MSVVSTLTTALCLAAAFALLVRGQLPPPSGSPCTTNVSATCKGLFLETPAECAWDPPRSVCLDCSSRTESECVGPAPSGTAAPSPPGGGHAPVPPCQWNDAAARCVSSGVACSFATTYGEAACESNHGYEPSADRCGWETARSRCVPCSSIGPPPAATCPAPTCARNATGSCVSIDSLCAAVAPTGRSSCEGTVGCYHDTSLDRCFACASLPSSATCSAKGTSKCTWVGSVCVDRSQVGDVAPNPTDYPASNAHASGSSKAAALIGGLVSGFVVLGVVVVVAVWYLQARRVELSDDEAKQRSLSSYKGLSLSNTLPKAPSSRASANSIQLTLPRSLDRRKSSLTAMSAPALFQEGKVTRLKLLGRGAFGSVYSCMLPDGSIIAMKEVLLPPSAAESEELVGGVMKEVSIVSSLEHPNVVRFYGSALESDEHRLTIFMELVPSGSLASMVRAMSAPMDEALGRMYARQITSALAYIHSQGVVHRDLKCDNLLLCPDGTVKLTDFGASKQLGVGTIATRNAQTMVGTPYFIAPEVLLAGDEDGGDGGGGYGRRADVWSLGITILEMLERGQMPWPAFPSTGAAFMHIATPGSVPIIPARLSDAAKDFLRLCCERDPAARATSEQLLNHPWLRDAFCEPSALARFSANVPLVDSLTVDLSL